MSERGAEFLIDWVDANINPADYPPEGDKLIAAEKAAQCLSAAQAAGLTQRDLESEVGPLAEFMRVRMSTPDEAQQLRWAQAQEEAQTPH